MKGMRLSRLRRITLGEVACRGRQHAARMLDRFVPAFDPAGEPRRRLGRKRRDEAAEAGLTRFLDTAPRRFFAGAGGAQAAATINSRFPDTRKLVLEEAARLVDGRFDLLGYVDLEFGSPLDWQFDPVADRHAPAVHWSRLDPLDANVVGDSKVIWELNRHQWLVTLAQAYHLTGNEAFAEAALDHVDHWIAENPYGVGINWASSLEVAFRIISWSWMLMLVRRSPALTPDRFQRLRRLMAAHACHVETYLSHYFSPNTHLTGEALGLVYAGVVFADLPDAARWRDTGRRILIEEIGRQVGDDGVYFEQATCYQHYTIEIYLHFFWLATLNHLPVPREVPDRIRQMLDHLLVMSRPDRHLPAIGDADGGWLLPLVRRVPGDSRGLFGLAAAIFEEPELAWAAGEPPPEVVWWLGAEGLRRFTRLGLRAPSTAPSRVFRTGGYVVMRDGWHRDAHQLILDVGPLGCSNTGAHGHADLLSLQVTAFGEEFIADPGTFCYTSDPAWRNYFRSTAAHSSVVVDGRSQADPAGPFAWKLRPSARLQTWDSTATHDYADAVHDSYTRLAQPVVHRRRVLFLKPIGWLVIDDLTGAGEHDIELRFHFSPRPVQIRSDLWTRAQGRKGHGLWLHPMSSVPLTAESREGRMNPIDGWTSPRYGLRRPSPVVVYRATTALPFQVTTVILPVAELTSAPPAFDVVGSPDNPTEMAFRFPDDERLVAVASDALTIHAAAGRLRIA